MRQVNSKEGKRSTARQDAEDMQVNFDDFVLHLLSIFSAYID